MPNANDPAKLHDLELALPLEIEECRTTAAEKMRCLDGREEAIEPAHVLASSAVLAR